MSNFLGIFVFMAINQKKLGIFAKLCMNVKTNHHHMNYLKLDYLIFLI
jgi:hypothetical protein